MGSKAITNATSLALCLLVASTAAGNPDLYDYDVPASFLEQLTISEEGAVDFTGDGNPDNALGILVGLLGQLPGSDINQLIADAIAGGQLRVGAAWPSFGAGVADMETVEAHFFELIDSDDDPMTTDAFYVDRASFDPLLPRHVLTSGRVDAGELQGQGTSFPLIVPLFDALLFVALEDVRIEARVADDANGVVVTEGTLSGVIPAFRMIEAMNEVYRERCPCLGFSGVEDILLASIDTETGSIDVECDPEVELSACDEAEEAACSSLSVLCAAITLIANIFDVDTDRDGIADGLSATFNFTMTGTRLLGPFGPPDCNQNGVPDADDIAASTSSDRNGNGLPDECEPGVRVTPFIRGDSNSDGGVDISDGSFTLSFLFLGGSMPDCMEAADTDKSDSVDITDAIYLFSFLFLGGPRIEEPFADCGLSTSPGPLSCDAYEPCRGSLWPSTEGRYLISNELEPLLPDGFPPLQDLVNEIFADPAVLLMTLMGTAVAGDEFLDEEPWNLLFECSDGMGPDGACTGRLELTVVGETVAALFEELLELEFTRLPGGGEETFRSAFSRGAEVFEDASSFSLAGLLEITQDPDEDGLLGDVNSLTLGQVTWRWRGGEQTILLREEFFSGSSSIEMRLEYSFARDGYVLIVSPFLLDLNYPELVLRVLESIVFSEFLSPEIESFEDLFAQLVNCESLRDVLEAEQLGAIGSAMEVACETLQVTAVSALESRFRSLADTFHYEYLMGTPPGAPCGLEVELSLDGEVLERLGSPQMGGRCEWLIEYRAVDGEDTVPLDGAWWGEKL